MTSSKRILVTTPLWEGAMACVQSLGRLGHQVSVIGSDPRYPLATSKYCRDIVVCAREERTDAYAEDLLRAVREGGYDMLIPISDRTIAIVTDHLDEIRKHTRLELPRPDQIALAGDKVQTMRFAQAHGVVIPPTYYPPDMEALETLSREIDYPCVAKLPVSSASHGVKIVHDAAALQRFFVDQGTEENWPFVQGFIAGDLYDVTAVCNHGRIVAHFAFRSPIDSQVGGTPPFAYTVNDPALLEATAKVLEGIGWHGAVDLDFLRGDDGRYYLLEVNPRFSGTINFAYKMGVDLPKAYFDVAFDCVQDSYQADYPDDVLFRTLVPSELWYVNRQGLKAVKQIVAKSFHRPSTTNVYWDDLPLLRRKVREGLGILRRRAT